MFANSSDKQWKQKYGALRDELRTRERAWSDLQALLQKAVVRVSIAAAGIDPRIEPALDSIRDAVRGDPDPAGLDHGLNALAAAVKRIEQTGARSTAAPAAPASSKLPGDLLITILERIEIGDEQRAGFLETIDYLSRHPTQSDEMEQRVITLLNSVLQGAGTTKSSAPTPSVPLQDGSGTTDWRRLLVAFMRELQVGPEQQKTVLQKTGGPPAEALNAALSELARELRPRLAGGGAPQASHGDDAQTLLLTLLDRIATVPGLESAAKRLRPTLQNDVSPSQWPGILRELSDALAEAVASVRAQAEELESFIGQVGLQLERFEAFVRASQDDLDSARGGRRRLSSRLGDEMRNIRANMDCHQDIGELKRSVLGSLDQIAEQIESFRNHEESRIQATEERNHELVRQIDELRIETNRLRAEKQEQLEQLMLDPLTKVHSRYAYEKRLEEEYSRWQRYGQALSYTIWDVDRFKSINDTYGHKAGDRLLQMVANLLARHSRKSDFLARIGGEEFVLLLPGTGLNEAREIARKLRTTVAETDFNYKGKSRQVTLSCGIVEFNAGDTVDSVYQRADAALYKAKHNGRNRCEVG